MSAGKQASWWTGGRIAAAIAVVLLLMGGAGFVGFLAGVAVGSTNSILEDFGDLEGFEEGQFDGALGNEVPGIIPPDAAADDGAGVRRGALVTGSVDGRPVDHPFVVESGASVTIEVDSDDFDTVLVVLDADGAVVTADDDSGGGTNSALTVDLEAGSYTVRVQPWSDFEDGTYELRLS